MRTSTVGRLSCYLYTIAATPCDRPAAGLILAGGAGRRFGDAPKQLAPLSGRALLQWAIDAQCDVETRLLDPIVIVLGARAAEVTRGIDPRRGRVVVCDAWREGQSASLRTGLAAVDATHDDDARVLVTLGDAPLLLTSVIARFAREPAPARAMWDGRPGHPVLLGRTEVDALADNRGDRGARDVIRGVRPIAVAGRGDQDVDTPEDLRAVGELLCGGGAGEA